MIERGFNYLIYEDKPDITFKIFRDLVAEDGSEGFCITTLYPKKLEKLYKIKNTELMWLSDSKSEDAAISPTRLDFEIARSMKKFIKDKGENGVVLLDGFEYLLLANDFDKVRKFLKSLSDLSSMNQTTFIVTINPQSFNKETATTLSRDFDKVGEAAEFFGTGKETPAQAPPAHSSHAQHPSPPQPTHYPQPQPAHYPQPTHYPPPVSPSPPMPSPQPMQVSPPQMASSVHKPSSGPVKELEIEDMYLIHRATGIMIQRKTWRQADLIDPDLIGGMLRAILDFVNDSFSSGEKASFSRFEIKGYVIFLYDGEQVSLATVMSGEHEEALVKHMNAIKKVVHETVLTLENEYRPLLENFDGHVEKLKGSRRFMDEISFKIINTISGRASAGVVPEKIPDSAQEFYNQGVGLSRQRKYPEAIQCYDQALSIEENYPRALFNKAVVLQVMGRVGEAIEVYRRLTALTPEDSEVWGNMAIALRSLGRTTDALECYNRAIAINPNDPSMWSNKGIALRALGRTDEAIQCYDQALAINPSDKSLWTNKGVALASANRFDEAMQCYNHALAIDPSYSKAQKNKEILERQMGGGLGLR
ncbi:MAG: tetratricopeptide repeat protein [Candidatus Thermoplasmatota archaeon]|nr:tetratricopeptide repeat protein [Candidatus Thermoplasmatota archaeon]